MHSSVILKKALGMNINVQRRSVADGDLQYAYTSKIVVFKKNVQHKRRCTLHFAVLLLVYERFRAVND